VPIVVPKGVTVDQKERRVTVKGPKGSLELALRAEIDVELGASEVRVKQNGSGPARESSAYHGLTRALLSSMVVGVTQGYEKQLEIIGVGWNAQVQGTKLVLSLGYCQPVTFDVPAGLVVEVPKPTSLVVRGADKQLVGQFAAMVRSVRPPEPYKGKGVRYVGEYVRKKLGKSFGS
jgi:large subunit ribosomal protein L6